MYDWFTNFKKFSNQMKETKALRTRLNLMKSLWNAWVLSGSEVYCNELKGEKNI